MSDEMSNDWRVKECEGQSLLYVVLATVAHDMPEMSVLLPRPFLATGCDECVSEVRRLVESPSGVTTDQLKQCLQRIRLRNANEHRDKQLQGSECWDVLDLVEWWLKAYECWRMWEKRVTATNLAASAPAPKAKRNLLSPLRLWGKDRPDSGHASADIARPVMWLAALLDVLRTFVQDDDAVRAIAWCIKWGKGLQVSYQAFEQWRTRYARHAGVGGVCSDRDQYLRALVRFASDPRPTSASLSPSDATTASEMGSLTAYKNTLGSRFKDLKTAVTDLLGETCTEDDKKSFASDRWAIVDLASYKELRWQPIRQPILHGGEPASTGVVVRSTDEFFVRAVLGDTLEKAAASSLARAARSALKIAPSSHCGDAITPSHWASTGPDDVHVAIERLSASVWFTTIILLEGDKVASKKSGEGDEKLRLRSQYGQFKLLMMYQACRFRWQATASDDGRLIIWRPVQALGKGLSRRLHCGRKDWEVDKEWTMDVGTCREVPSDVAFPEEIEEVDWHLWALNAARGIEMNEGSSRVVRDLLELADLPGWERHKRLMMEAAADLESSVAMFEHLHASTLRLDASETVRRCGASGAWLVDTVRRCRGAMIRHLHGIDPQDGMGMYPPRFVDGTCDLRKWIQDDVCADPRGDGFRVAWRTAAQPFGTQLEERVEDGVTRVTFSASSMTAADVALLNSPFLVICPSSPKSCFVEPFHRLGKKLFASDTGEAPDVTSAVGRMRKYLSEDAGRPAWNALVQAAIAGDVDALTWINILRTDRRFAFTCYPRLEWDENLPRLPGARPSDQLEWRDDAAVPADKNLEVFFALEPETSRWVISRGHPAQGSPEQLAASIETRSKSLSVAAEALGKGLREATDRYRMFGGGVDHPVKYARLLLGNVLIDGRETPDQAAVVFSELVAWCRALGYEVIPAVWLPGLGSTDVPTDCDAVRFHATVPAGHCVVEQFGVRGHAGQSFEGYVSAGPAPDGFADIESAVAGLSREVSQYKAIQDCVADLPRLYLAGKAVLAGPNLFNAIWNAVGGGAGIAPDVAKTLTYAVRRLLEASCGMALFEPTQLGDYAAPWVRGPDGKAPRGSWIVRVIRPGVRTVRNTLVWPAVVEME